MAEGFIVKENIAAEPSAVWNYLTDFQNAKEWMTGVDGMTQTTEGPLETGACFKFYARGEERETRITVFEPGKQIALTSTQGGVTATYTYSVEPVDDGTEITLQAVCKAKGFWKLIHPVIVFAMKKSDSSHLANLKKAMARRS